MSCKWLACAVVAACGFGAGAAPVDGTFTYQGALEKNGVPYTGDADLIFRLYDASAGGNLIGSEIEFILIPVENGLFSVRPDFGVNVFDGQQRWLEILAKAPTNGSYELLSGRQPLAGSPYAIQTRGLFVDDAGHVGIGTTTPLTELHIDGPQPTLLLEHDGNSGSFSEFKDGSTGQLRINKTTNTGQVLLDINPKPSDGVGEAFIRLFRETDTPAPKAVHFLRGNNSTQLSAQIGVDGADSYFQLHGGNVGIGTDAPSSTLHIRKQAPSPTVPQRLLILDCHDDANSQNLSAGPGSGILFKIPTETGSSSGASIDAIRTNTLDTDSSTAMVFRISQNDQNLDEAMRIDSSGNIGMGTISPTTKLHVESNGTAIFGSGSTGVYGYSETSDGVGTLGLSFSLTGVNYGVEGLNVSSLGRGVFGNATATTGTNTGVWGESGGNSGRGVYGWAKNTVGLNYGVSGQSDSTNGRGVYGNATATSGTTYGVYGEAHSSGGFGMVAVNRATTGAAYALFGQTDSSTGRGVYGYASHPSGVTTGVRGNAASSNGYDFLAAGAGTDYGSTSSIRWKRNIEPIGDPLGKLSRMRGVYFDWDADHGGHHDVGMIAEEVGEVLPEIVQYEENGVDAIGMDYSRTTPLLVEAVKALLALNEALGTRVDFLEAENGDLRARLDAMESLVEQIAAERGGVADPAAH